MSAAPKHTGQFLGNPYDWRRPTRRRLAAQKRARGDRRVLVPKAFGWGYTINFAAVRRRITAASAPRPRRSRPGSRRRPSRRVPRSSP